MAKKPPEWLSADIQACYAICQGNIRAIQGAIREKRGIEIAYMTISNRMDHRAETTWQAIEATEDRCIPSTGAHDDRRGRRSIAWTDDH